MVEPTNLKPRRERSLLIASDSAVNTGTAAPRFLFFVTPLTKRQM